MLKSETLSQIDKNDRENKQTEIVNGKKQILFFKFDDSSSNQQILPNYLWVFKFSFLIKLIINYKKEKDSLFKHAI